MKMFQYENTYWLENLLHISLSFKISIAYLHKEIPKKVTYLDAGKLDTKENVRRNLSNPRSKIVDRISLTLHITINLISVIEKDEEETKVKQIMNGT